MKRLRTTRMRLIATLLLILGTVPASAQYYLNIRQTDGTRLRYAVSAVDSLWFDKDEQQEPSGNYEYVDLGLSVMWATFNVGATAPEEYGDYFAWGETEPHYEAGYAQENPQTHWKDGYTAGYDWSTYKYCNGSYNTLTKYCDKSSDGYNGFTDTKVTLAPDDDVAHVKWGDNWRMPTPAELEELRNTRNCAWTWTTQNGVNGYLVTSKKSGHEGTTIFLPAAGCRLGTSLSSVGSSGFYWLSLRESFTQCCAWFTGISQNFRGDRDYIDRGYGFTIRPVYPPVIVKMDTDSVSLNHGDVITLTAVVEKNGQAVDFKVQWSSNNTYVATVSADGVVKGISSGTAMITAEYCGYTATCQVEVTKPDGFIYDYVDLGLSVKWATFNVGATAPDEYGDYFAWGEIEPYYEIGYAHYVVAHWKEGYTAGYDFPSYKYCTGSSFIMSKYCNNSNYGNNGFTDTKIILDPDDDVAHVRWGGDWRMPTQAELDELSDTVNCIWSWATRKGVNGFRVTSKKFGYEGASIFLPNAGYRYVTNLYGVGSDGVYWSSSLDEDCPDSARCLYSSSAHHLDSGPRYFGHSVRPVCP